MVNAEELIKGILYRMKQLREIEPEIVDPEGRALVRTIRWKGEPAWAPARKTFIVNCVLLTLPALLFGPLLGLYAQQEQGRLAIASVPAHEITLASLIKNGPGSNRHVRITDYQPGGSAIMAQSRSWIEVWIALFPPGEQGNEIKAVLSSTAIHDEAALQRLLLSGRITGICSEAPTDRRGTDMGAELEKVNQARLLSAWSIEELSEPPSATLISAAMMGSGACFVGVFVLAALVFWKGA
jgi:hypothetical protein